MAIPALLSQFWAEAVVRFLMFSMSPLADGIGH
jgi:hypothetical protein